MKLPAWLRWRRPEAPIPPPSPPPPPKKPTTDPPLEAPKSPRRKRR